MKPISFNFGLILNRNLWQIVISSDFNINKLKMHYVLPISHKNLTLV